MGKRRRVKKRFSIVSLLVLSLSFGSIFYYDVMVDRARSTISFGKLNSSVVESIPCTPNMDYERSVVFESDAQGIIKSDGTSFVYYGLDGQAIWEKEINSPAPLVRFGQGFVVVGDYGTGEIYALNLKGEIIQSIPGLGKLQDIKIGDNDVLVVLLEQDNQVVLLNKSLEEITRISLPKGDVIDFDLSANKSLLAFSFIKMDKSNFYSNVMLYSLDGRLIGATNFEQQFIFDLKVVEDKVIGVLDSGIFVLNGENELLQSLEIDRRIEAFHVDESGIIYLNLTKNPEDLTDTRPNNVITAIDESGQKVIEDIVVEVSIDQLTSDSAYLTFLSADKVYQLDKKTGELLKIQTLEKDALKVHTVDKTVFGIEYIDKFDIYSLTY